MQLGAAPFKWRLPLQSLMPQKACQKMSGAWTFGPWHGKALVAIEP